MSYKFLDFNFEWFLDSFNSKILMNIILCPLQREPDATFSEKIEGQPPLDSVDELKRIKPNVFLLLLCRHFPSEPHFEFLSNYFGKGEFLFHSIALLWPSKQVDNYEYTLF